MPEVLYKGEFHVAAEEYKRLVTDDLYELVDRIPITVLDDKLITHNDPALSAELEKNEPNRIDDFNSAWAKGITIVSIQIGLTLYSGLIKNYKSKTKRWREARPWLKFDDENNVCNISLKYIASIVLDDLNILLNKKLALSLENITSLELALGFNTNTNGLESETEILKSNNLSKRLNIDGLNSIIMNLPSIDKLEHRTNIMGRNEYMAGKTTIELSNQINKCTPTAQRLFLYFLNKSLFTGRIIKFDFEEYFSLLGKEVNRKTKHDILNDIECLNNIKISFPYSRIKNNKNTGTTMLSGDLLKTFFYYKNAKKNNINNGEYVKGEQIAFIEIIFGMWSENLDFIKPYYVISNDELFKIDLNKYRYAINLVIFFDSHYRINATNNQLLDENNYINLKMSTILSKCGISKDDIKKRGEFYFRDILTKHFIELEAKEIFYIDYDPETDMVKIKPSKDLVVEKYKNIEVSQGKIIKKNIIKKHNAIKNKQLKA